MKAASDDGEYSVRCWSVIALGNLGSYQATELLVRIIEHKGNPIRVRGLAAEALGKIGNKKVSESLMAILRDRQEEPWLKDNAVWALGKLGCHEAVPLIFRHIKRCWKSNDDEGLKLAGFTLPLVPVFACVFQHFSHIR